MSLPTHPHEEPGLSPLEFARLQDELQKSNAKLAAANTALRESERQLEQRVEERTRELSTLLSISRNITTTLELEPLLGLILDELKKVVDYHLASIGFLETEDELIWLAARGDGLPPPGSRHPLSEHANTRKMLSNRKPSFVPDLNADTPLAQHMRENYAALSLKRPGSWMSAPLIFRDKSIGTLTLSHPEVNYYHAARVHLAMAFANQAAVAITNARLYDQTRQLAALEERQRRKDRGISFFSKSILSRYTDCWLSGTALLFNRQSRSRETEKGNTHQIFHSRKARLLQFHPKVRPRRRKVHLSQAFDRQFVLEIIHIFTRSKIQQSR